MRSAQYRRNVATKRCDEVAARMLNPSDIRTNYDFV
jgi:hypothetical protein